MYPFVSHILYGRMMNYLQVDYLCQAVIPQCTNSINHQDAGELILKNSQFQIIT